MTPVDLVAEMILEIAVKKRGAPGNIPCNLVRSIATKGNLKPSLI